MAFPHLALPTTRVHRSLIALMVVLLLSGWVIQVVSLAVLQRRSYGGPPYEAPGPFYQTYGASQQWSLDWFFWAFFTFVNLYSLFAWVTDSKGGIAKNRIPISVYSAIAAVFCTYRIQDIIWNRDSSVARSLLSSYFIQGIPYYVMPLLFGTSFLNTSVDVSSLRDPSSDVETAAATRAA